MQKLQIEYICFTSHTGYAFAARNYILALKDKCNIRVVPIDRDFSKAIIIRDYDILTSLTKVKPKSNVIQVYHCIPEMFRRIKQRGRKIAFTVFEASTLPKRWIEKLNKCDAVIVPSLFNKEVFSCLDIPVYYVPHCLNFSDYHPNIKPRIDYGNKFVFLFCGTWKKRKGWMSLVQVWFDEFAKEENILLAIKTHDSKLASSEIRKTLGCVPPNIMFVNEILRDEELPSFFKSFDCLVLPTKGEGFGLPGLQALSVGVPTIITNYSGVQEYADAGCLLDVEGFEEIKGPLDSYYQFSNCIWPFISEEQLKNKMRQIIDAHKEFKQKALDSYTELSRKFSYETVGEQFYNVIEQIRGK